MTDANTALPLDVEAVAEWLAGAGDRRESVGQILNDVLCALRTHEMFVTAARLESLLPISREVPPEPEGLEAQITYWQERLAEATKDQRRVNALVGYLSLVQARPGRIINKVEALKKELDQQKNGQPLHHTTVRAALRKAGHSYVDPSRPFRTSDGFYVRHNLDGNAEIRYYSPDSTNGRQVRTYSDIEEALAAYRKTCEDLGWNVITDNSGWMPVLVVRKKPEQSTETTRKYLVHFKVPGRRKIITVRVQGEHMTEAEAIDLAKSQLYDGAVAIGFAFYGISEATKE